MIRPRDTLTERWRAGFCRIESGIFLPEGRVTLLDGDPQRGYSAGETTSLDALLASRPDGWAAIEPRCHAHHGSLSLDAGGGGGEGEGYIAVFDDDLHQLVWLIHLDSSELFHSIAFEGSEVIAHTGTDPTPHRWQIPLASPLHLRVSALP